MHGKNYTISGKRYNNDILYLTIMCIYPTICPALHIDFVSIDIIYALTKWRSSKKSTSRDLYKIWHGLNIFYLTPERICISSLSLLWSCSKGFNLAFRYQSNLISIWVHSYIIPLFPYWHLACGITCQKYRTLKFMVCGFSKDAK